MIHLNKGLAKVVAKAAKTDKNLSEVILSTVSKCGHKDIGELESRGLRVCLHCGVAEYEEYMGYLVLKTKRITLVTPKEYEALRTVTILSTDKGPLLRKEVTVEDIARKWLHL